MSGSCCSVVARADPAFTLFFRDTWATTNDGGPAARTAALLVEAPTQANARASHARAGASAPQLLHCCVPPSSLSRWEEEPAAASREERPSATNADLRRSVRAGVQPSGESPTRAAKPASGKGLLLRFSSQWLAGRCFPLSALCVVLARALAPLAPLPAAPFCALSVRPDGCWAILTPSPPFLCVSLGAAERFVPRLLSRDTWENSSRALQDRGRCPSPAHPALCARFRRNWTSV